MNIGNRCEGINIIEVENGNPNGDPDNEGRPRVDPETGEGKISDVAQKSWERNWVENCHGQEPGYQLFISKRAVLNGKTRAIAASPEVRAAEDTIQAVYQALCKQYYDARVYGCVASSGKRKGEKEDGDKSVNIQITGPIQRTFATSIESINPLHCCITRKAVATEEESEKQEGANQMMGRKSIIPFSLYTSKFFFCPELAKKTGFSEADFDVFLNSVENCLNLNRSAARGFMSMRKVILFQHSSQLGDGPAWKQFQRVSIIKKDPNKIARSCSDYTLTIDGKEVSWDSDCRIIVPAIR